ncbi:MAG: hypothetical protein JRN08_09175 [Nitrososphaerota archaeon]|nr:hypothetical protein [Nitrososphaerota archaeon]
MDFCGRETVDKSGELHRCGLPVTGPRTANHSTHVCGLPDMVLPLDREGTCRYNWPAEAGA